MSLFRERVLELVLKIPKGKVVSYGQMAAACGSPRSARQVGGVLRSLSIDAGLPWWRVVNGLGRISIKNNWVATPELQRRLLVAEGVVVAKDFTLDLDNYRHYFKI